MDPSAFLQTLSGAVASGFASHNRIAIGLSRRTGEPISSEAVHGRFFDFAFDLLRGEVVSHTLEAAIEQDKTIGKEVVAIVRENDLIVRDMGYFSLAEFIEIERRGAWWLTRMPLNPGLRTECGGSLEKLLQGHCGNIIDLPVKAGEAGHGCRLVAIRASSVVARKRRKQRRKEAKAKGVEP